MAALNLYPNGRYLDATFGRGGHSAGILSELGNDGRLLALDKDPEAIKEAGEFAPDGRFQICQASFAEIDEVLKNEGSDGSTFDGVLMDLGVSSPQLDDAKRGFSFRLDGPLDMRMDSSAGETAAEWQANVSEQELKRVLKEYGEERFSGRVARAIMEAVREGGIGSTSELAKIIRAVIPVREIGKDSATRSFQAIRIAVNHELEDLEQGLDRIVKVLNSTGRLVVITFHSLEDRIVKRAFKRLSSPPPLPRKLPVADAAVQPDFKIIGKPVRASERELQRNPRARSATMRVLEKVA